METKEKKYEGFRISGFVVLFAELIVLGLIPALGMLFPPLIVIPFVIFALLLRGFMMIEPNEARVMIFFGVYKGTITDNGFWWVNPFCHRKSISLRARNMDVEPIKVNDKAGNPVMIGVVLVWRVKDTYKAVFEIDTAAQTNTYQHFVSIQSDAALRALAGEYAYDNNNTPEELTLRSGGEEINDRLESEMNLRLAIAGIEVIEARINYLAYAPEIAAVMLRRQQASAIIAAREQIVEGAVSMVQMALNRLSAEAVVHLDEDQKAAMVSNLLVVLCADEQAQPVINTGTLHQ